MRIIAYMALLMCSGWLHAASVTGLYSATVPVASRDETARADATSQAMEEVLVKLTGSSEALTNPSIQAALARSGSYLESYGYSSDSAGEISLQAKFSQSGLTKLMRQAGLSLWPANRPKVHVWLVQSDFRSGARPVLPAEVFADRAEPLYQELQQRAQILGLPISLPLMDLEDQINANGTDLWSLNEAAIFKASARYSADAILVGKLAQSSSGQWRVGWWFSQKQQFEIFSSQDADLMAAIEDGLAQTTQYLASIYAVPVTTDASSAVSVAISGVSDFSDYAGVMNYLEQQPVISDFTFQQIADSTAFFTFFLAGDQAALLDAFALDQKLVPVTTISGGYASVLNLRWLASVAEPVTRLPEVQVLPADGSVDQTQ